MIRALLSQRACHLNLAAEPRSVDGLRETDEEALIRVLLEMEVPKPTADEAACRRYYETNIGRFRGPDLFEPLHILFQAPRDDKAAYAAAEQRAEAVLAQLKIGPGDFESLARALSVSTRPCPPAIPGAGPPGPRHGGNAGAGRAGPGG